MREVVETIEGADHFVDIVHDQEAAKSWFLALRKHPFRLEVSSPKEKPGDRGPFPTHLEARKAAPKLLMLIEPKSCACAFAVALVVEVFEGKGFAKMKLDGTIDWKKVNRKGLQEIYEVCSKAHNYKWK